jgi:UDP-glucose 4-epimerase|nr:hypothetical protein [uncultured Campylobacter sp.]
MKILITGGGGYIGSHVLKALDALTKIGKFKFVKANLEDDLNGIFAKSKFSLRRQLYFLDCFSRRRF